MGERKVINKYFPPDFDPTKIPRKKHANLNPNFVVRMMLPMSVRCTTCGEYMYKGKKFNSRKQDVDGPEGEYLGIKIFRFYFKCVSCSAEFTIKTDPQNMDYAVEGGVTRNFEAYKDVEEQKKQILSAREESEKDDPMAKLENKTRDSKMEMDILDALDEVRTQNAKVARLQVDDVIAQHREATRKNSEQASQVELDESDESVVRQAFAERVKRLRDEDQIDDSRTDAGVVDAGSALNATAAASTSFGASAAAGSSAFGYNTSTTQGASVPKRPKLPMGLVVQPRPKIPHAGTSTAAPSIVAVEAPVAAPAAPSAEPVTAQSQSSAPVSVPAGGALLGLTAYDSNESNESSSD
eukprot:CAMPEP_0119342056 /NCGR_PEP_ID=MMETSP1333-20130426/103916_1 /TAXON_ID=418940 /ORGANISM="Scyphosphaera apsteinii, Strain RCC1455" /LENGTH=352 /DNA_ID=CAMNT_0007354193 /DNA_START=15 /DNA_END=1073 /DNA_ORIENTATION=+